MKSSIKTNDSISYFEHNAIAIHQLNASIKRASWMQPFFEALPAKSRVLDLGCGSGIDLSFIINEGHEGVGIDGSVRMVELAQALNPRAQVMIKDVLFLNLKEAEFDGIWANNFFHLFKPEMTQRLVATCFKALKPRGIFGLVVEEGQGMYEENAFDLNGPSNKVYRYSEKQIGSMLEQTGFKIQRRGRNHSSLLYIAIRAS